MLPYKINHYYVSVSYCFGDTDTYLPKFYVVTLETLYCGILSCLQYDSHFIKPNLKCLDSHIPKI